MTDHPATATAETDAGAASGPRAGFWRRAGAALVDGVILVIPYLILVAVVSQALAYAIYLAYTIAYFTALEGSASGQTLGKRALGIRVIDFRTGGSIGPARAALRYVARILSALPFGLGYFWMLWDREKQTWHDKLSTNVVVPVDAYPVSR